VYEWSNEKGWFQRGETFIEYFDWFGVSVSLNSSGDTVAIGGNRGGDNNQGFVSVYEWDGLASKWNLTGEIQEGGADKRQFGLSVSISADALTLAARAPADHGGGIGVARVYKWS